MINLNRKLCILFCFAALSILITDKAFSAAVEDVKTCYATLNNDELTLGNSVISRTYKWNNGDLISASITDKKDKFTWQLSGSTPDCLFPGTGKAIDGNLQTRFVPSNASTPSYLAVSVTVRFNQLEVRRVFRIYPDCPAIACDFYLRGNIKAQWLTSIKQAGELRNIENNAAAKEGTAQATVMETLALPGKHWRLKAVEFFDITDRNNNLVQDYDQILYRGESKVRGNLLYASEILSDRSIFILKEAPTSDVQLAYPGFDYIAKFGSLQCVGIGLTPADLDSVKWTKCYGVVTGLSAGGEAGRLRALRNYQQRIRIHKPLRDDMVMMNTWGDRAQDSHISEKFILKDLVAAHRLGISHFQIDDGWQSGRSSNSALPGGSLNSIWSNPNYWKPDPQKFPNGLDPIVQLGKKLGIEICLWFNPSQDSSYTHWKDDAAALINLYKHYGICTFKIDGVQIVDKKGEVNFRRTLDSVMTVTNNEVVFNLDVTAGRRNGYHYFNEYGNIFLENRYTDWGNYYPHFTLRNLWQLSRYVPPQNLQIEFLNNSRNTDKYAPNDLLAPAKLSFDYGFALTMMAQPLAWMEATGLPETAFTSANNIKKYRGIQTAIHSGMIFPIGNEPSGTSWTGFQSSIGNKGYLLIIRENNNEKTSWLSTWLPGGRIVTLTSVLGDGKSYVTTTEPSGRLKCQLAVPNSYALYQYEIN
ncbi:alpha-galactosidase [Pedobacter sp. HMF7647]|uniref:Alpha-galactosidase n=1 Tax=Hufsiella arboris TaxID=2695275 RepID=A0A7K1YA47_9SPHI|nr:alpha-galactosidase [Hufsiella arboris]MXV51290.1 alpha-galactosidase [Hufsiella arboris]